MVDYIPDRPYEPWGDVILIVMSVTHTPQHKVAACKWTPEGQRGEQEQG